MSYSGAPLTPNKQWLYIKQPYTDGLVGDATKMEQLLCYAYSQGYTGFIMYQMSSYVSGGVLTQVNDWNIFINYFNSYGIDIAAAFGGPTTAQAVIDYSAANPAYKFKAIVTEIEWWNYSWGLPFQDPTTGAYSFIDFVSIIASLKPSASVAGVEIYMYCGWAKEIGDDYNTSFDIIAINTSTDLTNPNKFTIRGNFDVGGILNGNMYVVGQQIQVANYPTSGTTTNYTITNVENYFGNTRIQVSTPLTVAYNAGLDSKLLVTFDIVAADDILQSISIKGDKTGLFDLSGSYNRGGFARISGSSTNDGDFSVSQFAVYYDFGNDVTVVYLQSPGVINSTTADGFVTFEVSQYSAGSILSGIIIDGNELSQLYKLVDEYWLHDYIVSPGTPKYSYVQSRSQYIANDAAAWDVTNPGDITPGKKVEFIVEAGTAYSRKFFTGSDALGNLIYLPKNPINAYKYIVTQVAAAAPPQSGTPLYAKAETNANINTWLNIEGIVIFKDTDMRTSITGNGPSMLIEFGGAATIITSTGGTYPLTGTYCDDCLPFNVTPNNYQIQWNIQSKPVGSNGYVVPTTSLGACSGSFTTMLHYDIPGDYVIYVQVTDGPGSNVITKASNTFTLTISAPSSFDINSITQLTGLSLCSNGPLDLQIVTNYSNPTGNWSYVIYDPIGSTFTNGTTTLIGTTLYVSGVNWTAGNGAYSIIVTNDIGESATGYFTLNLPTEITATFVITDSDCFGNNGGATVTPAGGLAPYYYQWDGNPSLNTDTLSPTTAGAHTVEITDSNNCTKQFITYVFGPDPWDVTYGAVDPGCAATATGSISVTVNSGGFGGPYTYSWSHNPFLNSDVATQLVAGTYTFTVTDFQGCTYTSPPITLADKYSPISFDITGPTTVCNFGKNPYTFGTTNVVGTPVKFSWSNNTSGATTFYTFQNQPVGPILISCTMQDVFGCTYTAYYTIDVQTWNYTPSISVTGTPITSCSGSEAVITVTNPSGTGFWNIPGSPTTPTINIDKAWWDVNATPGLPYNFVWTATDPSSTCIVQANVVIDAPLEIQLIVDFIGPNPCGGPGNQGSIDVSVINGCPPYTYSWTSNVPGWVDPGTQDISGLQNGNYFVTVTDANAPTPNTTTLGPIVVSTSSPAITAKVANGGCGLGNSGSIDVTVTGGTAPYTYLWSDGVTTQDRSGLSAGIYTLVVTDDNGCTDQASYTIFASTNITVSITGTAPSGIGSNDGSATAVATGGNPPYTYLWSNGATTQTATGLDYGSYTVLVSSFGSCTGFANIIWTPPITQHPPVDPCVVDRLKCCASSIAYQYVKQRKNGLWDKAACTMNNLMLILGYIDDMNNYMEDGCLSVDEIQQIAEKANQICGCCGCNQNPYDDTL